MTLEQLFALGVTSTCGALDLKGKNIGVLTKDGPLISPEGEEILADLQPRQTAEPVAKPKKAKKAADSAPVDEDASLGDLFGDE